MSVCFGLRLYPERVQGMIRKAVLLGVCFWVVLPLAAIASEWPISVLWGHFAGRYLVGRDLAGSIML